MKKKIYSFLLFYVLEALVVADEILDKLMVATEDLLIKTLGGDILEDSDCQSED